MARSKQRAKLKDGEKGFDQDDRTFRVDPKDPKLVWYLKPTTDGKSI